MTNNGIGAICKWLSIILVALSATLMFAGAVKFTEKEIIDEFSEGLPDMERQINSTINELRSDWDDLEYVAADLGISYNKMEDIAEEFIDLMEDSGDLIGKASDVVSDGRISASEMAVMMPKSLSIQKKFKESELMSLARLAGANPDALFGDSELLENSKTFGILCLILFYLTLVVAVIVIILHIRDKSLPGVSIVIINLAWMILWIVMKNKVNDFISYDLGYDYDVMKITAAPVWALILSLLAMVLWLVRNNASPVYAARPAAGRTSRPARSGAYGGVPVKKMAARDPNAIVCGNCGNTLRPGAVFCPACGTKYTAPAAPARPIQPAVYQADNTVGVTRSSVCPNCGAQLDSDAMFCGECGYKRS